MQEQLFLPFNVAAHHMSAVITLIFTFSQPQPQPHLIISPQFGKYGKFGHFFLHLLGQNEDLLPSGVTLLVAFPEITQGKKIAYVRFFFIFSKTPLRS